MGKIVNFKSMSSKPKIVFVIIILIVVFILSWILRILNEKKILEKKAIVGDYNQIQDYTYFIYQGTTTSDRQLYWDLNDIIVGYIEASKYQNDNEDFSTDNYFDALTDEYQSYLGKNKYLEISKKFIDKFVINGVQELNYKTQDIIEEIYELQNDMYFCLLQGSNNKKAYIGIRLNKENKTYEIFYIE